MRVALGGIVHESNTFCPTPTDLAAFSSGRLLRGEAIRGAFRDAHHEVGGFLAGAGDQGLEVTLTLFAGANPAGVVPAETFEPLCAELCDGLAAAEADGIYLALHGAMVSESHGDAEGEVIARVRQRVGPDVPIVVTLDWHANISARMCAASDALVVYRTYPHLDQRQRGLEAADLLARTLRGEVHPVQALGAPPLILNLKAQETGREPMRQVMELAAAMTGRPGVLCANVAGGFPYADIPDMGTTAVVVTDGDQALADACARELAAALWDIRVAGRLALPPADEAVEQAMASAERPVVLVDYGDNVGGGSSANGPLLLRELLGRGAQGAVVTFWAPEAMASCAEEGIGAEVTVTVGGPVDDGQGPPLTVTGRVKGLFDGRYTEPEPRHGGARFLNQGPTAVLELAGDNLVVLTAHRASPNSLWQLRSLGIEPTRRKIVVVKAAIAYKAAYESIAGRIIEVDTPGYTAVDPTRFTHHHRRRPMHPFEDETEFDGR